MNNDENKGKEKRESEETEIRKDDLDIVAGARQTDQLDKLKENAEKDDSPHDVIKVTPADVKINKGSE
jgi:hypothetical protein